MVFLSEEGGENMSSGWSLNGHDTSLRNKLHKHRKFDTIFSRLRAFSGSHQS